MTPWTLLSWVGSFLIRVSRIVIGIIVCIFIREICRLFSTESYCFVEGIFWNLWILTIGQKGSKYWATSKFAYSISHLGQDLRRTILVVYPSFLLYSWNWHDYLKEILTGWPVRTKYVYLVSIQNIREGTVKIGSNYQHFKGISFWSRCVTFILVCHPTVFSLLSFLFPAIILPFHISRHEIVV